MSARMMELAQVWEIQEDDRGYGLSGNHLPIGRNFARIMAALGLLVFGMGKEYSLSELQEWMRQA